MGRLQPSVGQPPASFRKAARAKKAKATINQLIPSLLSTHPRARRGIDTAELIVEPKQLKKHTGSTNGEVAEASCAHGHGDAPPRLVLRVADTLTAARSLVAGNQGPDGSGTKDASKSETRVAILNMASPLTPGGGFLNGASSQEESLCMRTTLLPSLKDEYYRLPELGAVYTPDVLVFREESEDAAAGAGAADDTLLGKQDRWFVDCVSAAMLRNPETERDEASGFGRYVHDSDRQLVAEKMRAVLRICQAKGVGRVVLGAWGCGAYGNPVGEIAAAWRRVLLPRKSDGRSKRRASRETWSGIGEIVFAIKDAGMADAFEVAFGEGLVREEPDEADEEEGSELDPEERDRSELQDRIRELEVRIEKAASPQLKDGLRSILAGLVSQLPPDGDAEDA